MHGTSCVSVLGLPTCQLTGDDVKNYVLGQWPNFTVNVTWPSPPDPGTTVAVKVSGTFQPLFWFFAAFPTISYSNTAKMVIEQ